MCIRDSLCTARGSWLKRAYRAPLDYLEEATTAMADVVVVNSLFTASIFKQAFPTIARSAAKEPSVLYPVADFASFTPPDWAAKEGKKKKKKKKEEEEEKKKKRKKKKKKQTVGAHGRRSEGFPSPAQPAIGRCVATWALSELWVWPTRAR